MYAAMLSIDECIRHSQFTILFAKKKVCRIWTANMFFATKKTSPHKQRMEQKSNNLIAASLWLIIYSEEDRRRRQVLDRNRMRMENINVKLQNIFFFIGLLIAIQCATATANECLCFGRTQRMHSTPMEKPLNQKKKRKRHLSAAAVAATVRNLQWKKNISAPLVARHCQVVKLHRALCIGSFIGSTAQLDWYFYHNWFNETGFSLSFSRCQSTSSSRHVPATSGQTITFISSSCIQQVVEWLRWNSFMEWIQFLAAHEQWTCLTACTQ